MAYGPWGIFLIGLIDSIGVPLPAAMDVLIILIAVKAPQRAYLAASMGVLGSIGGNAALFEMARFGVRRFVREALKEGRLHDWFHRYGLVVSRVLRYFGVAFLGAKLGADAQGFLQRNAWILAGIAVGVTLVLLWLMRWTDRHGEPAS